MVSIQNTTQNKFLIKSLFLVCLIIGFFFLTASYAYADAVDDFIHGVAIGTGGFFAGLGGMMFDGAMTKLVLQMGDLFINKGLGGVVTDIWTMIRDLFNILFIFSLVYIGLRTIWDSDDSRTKKMLGMLIAAALLINFSLYIAKVVVDISNFTAVEIHKTATGGLSGKYGIDGAVVNYESIESSISGAYMQVLNVSSWFSTDQETTGAAAGGSFNVIVYSIMALLFLMFLGFVLAYGALMLTVRFIAIIFYLMFSPIMFLGWVLPQFQQYSTKWWKGFLGYCFFAPVYIFMLYIGLYSLQQIKSGFGADASFGDVFGGGEKTVDTFSIFLLFIIGTGFLVAATKVAGSMSQGGAAIGMNVADKMSRRVTTGMGGRFGRNAAGSIGRNTIGRVGAGLLQGSEAMQGSRTGRNLKRFATVASLGTIDEQARKGAFKSMREGKYGGSRSHASNAAWSEENKKLQGVQESKQKLKSNIKTGGTAMERSIADASGGQLESLGSKTLSQMSVAGALSGSQFESVMKSDKFNDTEKGKIAVARRGSVTDKLRETPGDETSRVKIEDASMSQLDALGSEFVASHAADLTTSQMDDIKKKFTESEFGRIKDARKGKLWENFNANPSTAFLKHNGNPKKDKEIGQLPDRILKDNRSLRYINPNILKIILDKESLSPAERNQLRVDITGNPIYTEQQERAFEKFFESALGSQF